MHRTTLLAFSHHAAPALRVDRSATLAQVEADLRADHALAGVLVDDGGEVPLLVTRRAFFTALAERLTDGAELTSSVIELARRVGRRPVVHAASERPEEALAILLTRPDEQAFDPLFVRDASGREELLDTRAFLAELSRLHTETASALGLEQERTRRATQVRTNLLTSLGREVRTPIQDLLGVTGLLWASALTVEQRELLDGAAESVRGLLAIVDDLEDFTNIEQGRLAIDRGDFDLVDVFDELVDTYGERAREKGLELVVEVAPDLPECVHGDVARVRQVLASLLDNAVKYTTVGRVVLGASMYDAVGAVELLVSDDGVGMSPETVQQAFEPFEGAESGTTRRLAGLGLGLAVVRKLVHAMGGTIAVESTPGRGTTFRVHLPLASDADLSAPSIESRPILAMPIVAAAADESRAPEIARPAPTLLRPAAASAAPQPPRVAPPAVTPAATAATPSAASPTSSTTAPIESTRPTSTSSAPAPRCILVVDDEPVARSFATSVLKRAGFIVEAVDNGERALARLAAQAFDLVLMDVQMPLLGGIEATRRLRQARGPSSSAPVLGLSGSAERATRDDALAAGMLELLLKPIVAGELVREVNIALGAATVDAAPTTSRVLVVDDQAVSRRVAQAVLARRGARVRQAADGVEALAAMERETFDLVLLDLFMPRLGGLETLDALRQRGDRTPVVVLSGAESPVVREQAIGLGAAGWVQKPIREDDLLEAFDRIVGRTRRVA